MAVTDHGPAPYDFDPDHRMKLSQFGIYRNRIHTARLAGDCNALFGVEADYFEGCEPFMSRWLKRHPFDLVLGSIHFLGSWNTKGRKARSIWKSSDVHAVWRRYFELIGEMADTKLYDVVTHLDLPKREGHRPRDRHLPDLVLPALDRIARAGMAIEINTSGLRHPVNEIYPAPRILAWAREREIPIVFGSDAHRPERVAADFGQAVTLARAAGYTHSLQFRRRERRKIPLPD